MFHTAEKLLLVSILLLLIMLGFKAATKNFSPKDMTWGVSFDSTYAWSLGLDPQKTLEAILGQLKVDNLRLTARWDQIEKKPGVFDWSDLDWQMNMAKQHGAKVLLTVGRKLPRWPECYQPDWWNGLAKQDQENEVLKMVEAAVNRYKSYDNVIGWQVENEPLVGWFGVCPAPSPETLKKEIALVKSLDSRPVVTTDSGELSTWYKAAKYPDVLGTTMYRVVNDKYLGYFTWPLPPAYYHYKAAIIQKLTGVKKVIVSELQAEPWAEGTAVQNMSVSDQYRSMSPDQFKNNIAYVQKAGFDTAYLWGAEWWYWMKEHKGINFFWTEAGKLWQK